MQSKPVFCNSCHRVISHHCTHVEGCKVQEKQQIPLVKFTKDFQNLQLKLEQDICYNKLISECRVFLKQIISSLEILVNLPKIQLRNQEGYQLFCKIQNYLSYINISNSSFESPELVFELPSYSNQTHLNLFIQTFKQCQNNQLGSQKDNFQWFIPEQPPQPISKNMSLPKPFLAPYHLTHPPLVQQSMQYQDLQQLNQNINFSINPQLNYFHHPPPISLENNTVRSDPQQQQQKTQELGHKQISLLQQQQIKQQQQIQINMNNNSRENSHNLFPERKNISPLISKHSELQQKLQKLFEEQETESLKRNTNITNNATNNITSDNNIKYQENRLDGTPKETLYIKQEMKSEEDLQTKNLNSKDKCKQQKIKDNLDQQTQQQQKQQQKMNNILINQNVPQLINLKVEDSFQKQLLVQLGNNTLANMQENCKKKQQDSNNGSQSNSTILKERLIDMNVSAITTNLIQTPLNDSKNDKIISNQNPILNGTAAAAATINNIISNNNSSSNLNTYNTNNPNSNANANTNKNNIACIQDINKNKNQQTIKTENEINCKSLNDLHLNSIDTEFGMGEISIDQLEEKKINEKERQNEGLNRSMTKKINKKKNEKCKDNGQNQKKRRDVYRSRGKEYAKEQLLSYFVEAYGLDPAQKLKGQVYKVTVKYQIDYVTFLRWKFLLREEYQQLVQVLTNQTNSENCNLIDSQILSVVKSNSSTGLNINKITENNNNNNNTNINNDNNINNNFNNIIDRNIESNIDNNIDNNNNITINNNTSNSKNNNNNNHTSNSNSNINNIITNSNNSNIDSSNNINNITTNNNEINLEINDNINYNNLIKNNIKTQKTVNQNSITNNNNINNNFIPSSTNSILKGKYQQRKEHTKKGNTNNESKISKSREEGNDLIQEKPNLQKITHNKKDSNDNENNINYQYQSDESSCDIFQDFQINDQVNSCSENQINNENINNFDNQQQQSKLQNNNLNQGNNNFNIFNMELNSQEQQQQQQYQPQLKEQSLDKGNQIFQQQILNQQYCSESNNYNKGQNETLNKQFCKERDFIYEIQQNHDGVEQFKMEEELKNDPLDEKMCLSNNIFCQLSVNINREHSVKPHDSSIDVEYKNAQDINTSNHSQSENVSKQIVKQKEIENQYQQQQSLILEKTNYHEWLERNSPLEQQQAEEEQIQNCNQIQSQSNNNQSELINNNDNFNNNNNNNNNNGLYLNHIQNHNKNTNNPPSNYENTNNNLGNQIGGNVNLISGDQLVQNANNNNKNNFTQPTNNQLYPYPLQQSNGFDEIDNYLTLFQSPRYVNFMSDQTNQDNNSNFNHMNQISMMFQSGQFPIKKDYFEGFLSSSIRKDKD